MCYRCSIELCFSSSSGNGFDRHLFAIKCLAALDQQTVPLFDDPAYVKLNHIILSTSTLSADSVLMGGFAPVTDDGYGMGYGITDDTIGENAGTCMFFFLLLYRFSHYNY